MKYIIRGDAIEIVEAENKEEANNLTYDAWREDIECQADYEAIEYDDETWEDMR